MMAHDAAPKGAGVGGFRFASALSLVATLALSMSCDGGNGDTGGPAADLEITEDNNYEATSVLNLPTIQTASGENIELCFGDVSSDLRCQDVSDPTESIGGVVITKFEGMTTDEIAELLGRGGLEPTDVAGVYTIETDGESCVTLEDAKDLGGGSVDPESVYVEAPETHYVAVFGAQADPLNPQALTMAFIEPLDDEENTMVEAVSGCDPDADPPMLEFSADIESADPLDVPAEGDSWVIGWRDIETDGVGNDFSPLRPDRLLLGYYEGMEPSDIEDMILVVEDIATDMWELELEDQRTADLADAVHRDDDENFEGFEDRDDGTWIVALLCSECQNPAPQVLTVLNPE